MATLQDSRAPLTPAAPVFHEGFCAARNRRLILIAAILASSMGFIDGTVVAIAIPAMREGLGATLAQAQWINNAYMLTLSALVLVGGALGDRVGLARVFALGIGVFVVASLFCAIAPTPGFLIGARLVQGAGAALMVPGSLAIISRAYPREERGAAIGTWAAASAVTTALGPIIGGLALSLGGPEMWRWIFAVNLPFGAAALWLIWRSVQNDRADPGRGIDLPGAALTVLGLGLIAWSLTGAEHGGDGPGGALYFGLAGVAVLGLFLWVEARSPSPMLDLSLFANRSFSAANLATFGIYFALSSVMFFLPMTAITAWGVTPFEASAAFAPLSVFIGTLSARAGRLADRIGPRPLIAGGAAVVALAFTVLGMASMLQNFWGLVLPAMCLMGLGMSMVVAPLSTAVMAAAGDNQAGAASGINNAVTRISGLIAVAAMGGVVAAAYRAAGGAIGFGIAGDAAQSAATSTAFATVAWCAAGVAALASLVAWSGLPAKPQTGS